ncbi:MAG: hypothetical protein Q7S53_00135 [bacterium]|nr:hypothetical protein [bacterium]
MTIEPSAVPALHFKENPCYDGFMGKAVDDLMDKFIEDYNLLFNVPADKATKGLCNLYKNEHPNDFKKPEWSIEKHRKRFMDWISRQRPETLELLNK